MRPLVNLQILTSGENLSASSERTSERLLASVDPNMIDQLVFGFKGPTVPATSHPKAGVCRTFRAADMLDRQMADNFVHRVEHFTARFAAIWAGRLIRVHPQALHLLLDGRRR